MSIQAKKKSTVAIAIAAIGAAAITLGAGTFAFFSSTQTGPGGTAIAGTLDFGSSASGDLNVGPLYPGALPLTKSITFKNGGTIAAKMGLSVGVQGHEDGCHGDELAYDGNCNNVAGPGQLPSKVHVKITAHGGANTVYEGALSALTTTSPVDAASGEDVTYVFEFSFPNGDANDNAAQGDTATLTTTTATLQQTP